MPELRPPSPGWRCRWCGAATGDVVLDAGPVPAADRFPLPGEAPDPVFGLAMVLCRACGLAQLEDDPTCAAEPRGLEPAALVLQARAAISDLVAAGLASPAATVREFPSPHGGSWLGPAADAGLVAVPGPTRGPASGPADLVVDSFGLMHEPDQRAAWRRRATALAPHGVLAVHVHSLATIVRDGTWNALRHGHFAYYSVPALVAMARAEGLSPVRAWTYGLYGGTVLIAFRRGGADDGSVARLERSERAAGVLDSAVLGVLGSSMNRSVAALRDYVHRARVAGLRVAGYGAASRAVALLAAAGLGPEDLRIGDASPAKQGRTMPGSRIPIVSPEQVVGADRVIVFVPDLLKEARRALPGVEAAGGQWVVECSLPQPAHQVRPGPGGRVLR